MVLYPHNSELQNKGENRAAASGILHVTHCCQTPETRPFGGVQLIESRAQGSTLHISAGLGEEALEQATGGKAAVLSLLPL